jgi:pilus assembly protein CpaE
MQHAPKGDFPMNLKMNLGLDASIPDTLSADTLSIAVIGPDEVLREAVVAALAGSHQGEVRQFSSYPPSLDDLPRLLQQYHDVILIEWDSNPEYALDLVEGIGASAKATVMVYSKETDPGKTDPELLMRCMRVGAREFLCMPFSRATVAEALVRAAARRPPMQKSKKKLGRQLVFCGSKGGAGVTAIACNFAVAIAQESLESTLLIDLDLPLGDAALNLGIKHEYSTIDALENFSRLDANFLSSLIIRHESGLYVLPAPGNYSPFQATDEAIAKLLSVARENFKNVVVDAGSKLETTGNTTPFKHSSTIFLVTQSGIPELRNANRLILQNARGDGPNLEVVLNRYESQGMRVSDDDIKRALTMPARWKIPNDYAAMSLMHDTAVPVTSTDCELGRQFEVMARVVCGLPEEKEKEKKRGRGFFGFLRSAPSQSSAPQAPERPSLQFVDRASRTPITAPGTGWFEETPSSLRPAGIASLQREEAARREQSLRRDAMRESEAKREREMFLAREALQRRNSLPEEGDDDHPLSLHAGEAQLLAQSHAEEPDYLRGVSAVAPRYIPEMETDLPLYIPETYSSEPGYDEAAPDALPFLVTPVSTALNLQESATEEQSNAHESREVAPCAASDSEMNEPAEVLETSGAEPEFVEGAPSIEPKVEIPTIAWPEPESIAYGTPLGAKQFNATASAPGSFIYIPAEGYLLPVGFHTLWVTFIPRAGGVDCAVQACVSLEVGKAIPQLHWPVPSILSGGTPLSDAQLNAQASVPGVFVYSPCVGEVPAAGDNVLSVTFTPTDHFNFATVQAEVPLVVSSAPSTVYWPNPAAIPYGTELGAAQLNATASCAGTFSYTPGAGSVLPIGKHVLYATFLPADGRSAASTQATVQLVVRELESFGYVTAAIPQAEAHDVLPSPPTSGVGLAAQKRWVEETDDKNELPPQSAPIGHLAVDLNQDPKADYAEIMRNAAENGSTLYEESAPEARVYKGTTYFKGADDQWYPLKG